MTVGCIVLLWFRLVSSFPAMLMGMHLHFVYGVSVLITIGKV